MRAKCALVKYTLRGLAYVRQLGLAPLELLLMGHQRRLILGIVLLLQLGDGALALGGLGAHGFGVDVLVV